MNNENYKMAIEAATLHGASNHIILYDIDEINSAIERAKAELHTATFGREHLEVLMEYEDWLSSNKIKTKILMRYHSIKDKYDALEHRMYILIRDNPELPIYIYLALRSKWCEAVMGRVEIEDVETLISTIDKIDWDFVPFDESLEYGSICEIKYLHTLPLKSVVEEDDEDMFFEEWTSNPKKWAAVEKYINFWMGYPMEILQIADIADEISAATDAEVPASSIIDNIYELLETTEEELGEEDIALPKGIIAGVLLKTLQREILRNHKVAGIVLKVNEHPTQINKNHQPITYDDSWWMNN